MGAVYEAVDLRLESTVAIKEAFSSDARLRKQFEQEARLLAQLHHPALPRVTDYFTEGDRVFLVMQFIAGDDLADIIANNSGPLPRNQVIAWADQLLDALVYLHTRDRQIVHRDIKPHNLKLTANGRIALLDFGLAKADSDTTANGSSASIFGFTRRYSPPEQMQDQGTSPRSDIYALGATLYHLMTAVKPSDALARAAALVRSEDDPLKPANEIHPGVGPEVAAILRKAMALNPEQRFADANEFRESLRGLGRNEMRAAGSWSVADAVEASKPPNINTTLVGKPPALDPFDSYSILKPAEMNWLIPKPSRRPFVIAGLLGLLLAGGAYAFSDAHNWIDLPKAAGLVQESSTKPISSSAPAQMKTGKSSPANSKGTSRSAMEVEPGNAKRARRVRPAENSLTQGLRISESLRARRRKQL